MSFDQTLTPEAPDVPKSDLKLDIQESKLSFKGPSQSKKVNYAVELEFFGEIDPKETKTHHTERAIDFVLRKKELKEEYWPRLLKDSKKQHFLKTDFDKWVDEDEQDEQADDEDYMSKMNPMGGDGGFGGIDFSKLGQGAGAGGLPDLDDLGGEEGGESSDDEDDDMPELENDDEKAAEGAAGKAKIEEIS